MTINRFISVAIIFLAIQLNEGYAQVLSSKDIVDVSAQITGKEKPVLEIRLDIKDGWHINSNKPFDDYLTPTMVALKDSSYFSSLAIEYPEPDIENLAFSQSELSLYRDQVTIMIKFRVKDKFEKKDLKIEGTVFYQPCNDQSCLFPAKKAFSVIMKPQM